MDIHFDIHITLDVPQLSPLLTIGRNVVANLSNISTALDTLSSTLDTELTQIQDALMSMNGPTQEEVDAVAQRVSDLRDRISNIIP